MRVIGGLWYQDIFAAFDEMMTADICHQLRAWQDLGVKLFLNLMELLRSSQSLDEYGTAFQHTASS